MTFDLRHALTVASRFPYGTDEWRTALLHDALEDGALVYTELTGLGFRPRLVEALLYLTRQPDETYDEYILEVAKDPLARKVKIADLEANLARMDPEHESLRPRYTHALYVLKGIA